MAQHMGEDLVAEPGSPPDAWPAVRSALDELAVWVGAEEVALPRLPRPWR